MIRRLVDLVEETTTAFQAYDYARCLERTEAFFWNFTDLYLELVKNRSYGSHGDHAARSAQAALRLALGTVLKLFAPILPYVTEEIWSWWRHGSIHRSSWPSADALGRIRIRGRPPPGHRRQQSLGEIRKAKSEAKVKLSQPVNAITVSDTGARLSLFTQVQRDVMDAGRVLQVATCTADEFEVDVSLGSDEPS